MTEIELDEVIRGRQLIAEGHARFLRLDARLSQVEIADACGVVQASISAWERGNTRPAGDGGRVYCALIARLAAGSPLRVTIGSSTPADTRQ